MPCPHDNSLSVTQTRTGVSACFEGLLGPAALATFSSLFALGNGQTPPPEVTLDLSGAVTFDKGGPTVLRTVAEKLGGRLRIRGAGPELSAALVAAGLVHLLYDGS